MGNQCFCANNEVSTMRELNDIEELHKIGHQNENSLSTTDLDKLDIFTRYEKSFPFYQMNIQGYMSRIKHAISVDHAKNNTVDYVSQDSLSLAFPNW